MNPTLTLIAEQLDKNSITIVDDLLPTEVLQQLLSELKQSLGEGEFHAAHIRHGAAEHRISEIRGDKILWMEESTLTPYQQLYFSFLDELRTHLSNYFRIALPWQECHLAAYPEGSFYTRHFDQFRETNNRIFSTILYLNEYWKENDVGQLRVYNDTSHQDIGPLFGRFVCFRSDVVEHEVLVTAKPRFSITGWIRRDRPTPVFLG